MSRTAAVAVLALLGVLALTLLLQAWATAAQAAAVLGAQLLACLLGALLPAAFLAGFRLAGGEIRPPALPRRIRERPAVPASPGRIPDEIMEVIREWWA